MDDARWQRVEAICGGALNRTGDERLAFVAAACGDDEALRHEVEALLTHAASAETFLGTSIGLAAAAVLRGVDGASLAGCQIGSYTVLSLIGVGGMGDVYRAHDARLARDVAIKILPAGVTADPSHRRRFLREARAIAGLNHPDALGSFSLLRS
jgi:serine/threonine protein kinase